MKKYLGIGFLAAAISTSAFGFEPFVIKDIRLEGLQRISAGTVFNYLPVKVGDQINNELSSQAIRALYKTGFFKDVRLEQEGDALVVFVAERPAIADVIISGNSAVPTEQLEDSLKQIGLTRGKVLDRSLLDKIEQELERQYYSLGKYGVKIDTETSPLERNRVKVSINIAEGEDAKVYAVNIVGNELFTDEILLGRMQLGGMSFFGGRKQYSKQLLGADLETIKSFYLDRGYINFNIDSTQVSLTPDKQDVYVTVNVTEGEQYTVRNIKLAGDLIVPKNELMDMISLKEGDVFSRKLAVESTKRISDRLSEDGYAFANVNIVPDVDKDTLTVGITLFVDPGKRVYVRRINVSGNSKTKDEVIRRELRQLEGDWMSSKQVSLSRSRLDRTGYFETVSVETPAVPGASDQVDINYAVKEQPTGNLSAGIGYSDTQGILINLGVSQENFLGTGKRVAVNIDNSQVTQNYSFSYTNPYHTIEGVSRGFRIYYRAVDALEANISNYTTDSYGVNLNYGFPLGETTSARMSIGFENTELLLADETAGISSDIIDFVQENGNVYDDFPVTASWVRDTRNKRLMANKGSLTTMGTQATVPGSDLEYYKLNFRHLHYIPLGKVIALSLNTSLGYGDGYGDTSRLPPFKNYFAGGSRTVRGYDSNSLGPRDPVTGDPTGGDRMILGNIELILPNPLETEEGSGSTRVSAFIDFGNVYRNKVELSELRGSTGLSLLWLSPVGALTFSYAIPFNDQEGDELQAFQFTLGSAF
ncbi:MAG: outer membrane protein assembly factor BamA [Gammaproteobacteria bacterium]|nr:outer membrane protein assembly factor BamA [Gammaproteobacteria bacterium]